METKILSEIKEIKTLLSKIIGTSDLPIKQRFSKEAIQKAAKEFRVLQIKHNEWVVDYEIHKVIRSAPHSAAKFIINNFEFTNYFKYGHSLYFNRNDLVALNKELKKRNVNLKRYIELIEEQEKFQKKVEEVKTSKKKGKGFRIPEELRDIELTKSSPPDIEIVKNHIEKLKKEFTERNLSEYVEKYETVAFMKTPYYFQRYYPEEKFKICRKWCEDFNYANSALREIINTKSY